MKRLLTLPALFFLLSFWCSQALALTPEELEKRFKQLPTVPEAELPEMPNEKTSFRGLIEHKGLTGNTWVTFPFVENPGSFGFDAKGRLFVAEANRFWLGVPDLRGANELIRDDFKAVTVEDRLKMYEKFSSNFPEGWFSRVADRIIRLEDRDGNGVADHRTLFSDRFKEPLDGIGFSLLADEGSVFFTCIPHVWKLTDTDDDGVADKEEVISTGYGVRVSFIGHDLHGIIRGPDGRLYFSVGDRGYHVTDAKGVTHPGSGKGAIFRCESDGSGLEVFCGGLRNPQELAFDDYGNLFTFDNTGDIGDLARMVYALEGTDSGWDMSHQSPHHYRTHLDWGEFHPKKSMWVAEKMFDTWNEEQPQWVYPPASHVARGPSGVTYLTGDSLPDDLKGKFLLANYRGPSANCTVLSVGVEPKGAGYHAVSEEVVFKGVGASDVELGFDGKIYLCDFGGGWSINTNGSIQVAEANDPAKQEAGKKVAALFAAGFKQRNDEELVALLSHPDRRVRQEAQFALVDREVGGKRHLTKTATSTGDLIPRLHAIWGLGQAGRRGIDVTNALVALLQDPEVEVRANAARVIGDLESHAAKGALALAVKEDSSDRVRSLAAIALSRVGERGEEALVDIIFQAVEKNGAGETDVVLRHALLTAIDRLATESILTGNATSESREVRLLSLLALRRHESPAASQFLGDADPQILRETIRAIYDTEAVDSEAGDKIASLVIAAADLPETVQARIVAANYRRGNTKNAKALLSLAGMSELPMATRKSALLGLQMWTDPIETDPVHGTYRPISSETDRSSEALATAIGDDLRRFLAQPHDSELITLGTVLATKAGIALDPNTLMTQVVNEALAPELRAAILDSLAQSKEVKDVEALNKVITDLWKDKAAPVRAAAIREGFSRGIAGVGAVATTAIEKDSLPVARAALEGWGKTDPSKVNALWSDRQKNLRRGLWLDAYLALSTAGDGAAEAYAATSPNAVFDLSLEGGDVARGEIVFKNQGACLQCHKVGSEGGVQGPDLSGVGKTLNRAKILESVVNPGAEITEGYGMTTVTLASGDSVVGRLATEAEDHLVVVGLDNKPTRVDRSDVKEVAPPISAMPPVAMTLPPRDLRDLVAYLAAQKKAGKKNSEPGGESHGDDEKIAK